MDNETAPEPVRDADGLIESDADDVSDCESVALIVCEPDADA